MDRGNEVRSRERCRRRVSEKCKTGEVRRQSERDVRSLETKSIQLNALPGNLDSGDFEWKYLEVRRLMPSNNCIRPFTFNAESLAVVVLRGQCLVFRVI